MNSSALSIILWNAPVTGVLRGGVTLLTLPAAAAA
jgi:hypothetical protein